MITRKAPAYALFLGTLAAASCLEGGANNGGVAPGNRPGGHLLVLGDIALDPTGRYFFSLSEQSLVIGDLEARSLEPVPDLPRPDLIAFWEGTAPGLYLVSWGAESTGAGPREQLISFDLATRSVRWSVDLAQLDVRLDVSKDGRALVLTGERVVVVDPASGAVLATHRAPEGIHDVDLRQDGASLVITSRTRFDEANLPHTKITLLETLSGRKTCEVEVPNCASDLVLAAGGQRGFLAPTRCQRDPVSVIELDRCQFAGNLPGFGPVALSPDGETVVAFMDRDANDPTAPPIPTEVKDSPLRYHLMFVDSQTLAYETVEMGDHLPRYAFTPDGASLLVDHDLRPSEVGGDVVLLDVEARTVREIQGARFALERYALTPDSRRAFVVDQALYDLDLEAARAALVPLSFVPISLNMTPDGGTLLLKSTVAGEVYVFSTTQNEAEKLACAGTCQAPLN